MIPVIGRANAAEAPELTRTAPAAKACWGYPSAGQTIGQLDGQLRALPLLVYEVANRVAPETGTMAGQA